MIDPDARVDDAAIIADGASVGPWSIIGPGVEIGPGTVIGPHSVIKGPTRIGRDNRIFGFSSIGDIPQDKKFVDDPSCRLEIGDRNTIREFCTINRGTLDGGSLTRLGDDNWIMAYCHIAHDCLVGNGTTFANNATLAGHVIVDDFVTLGGFTGVHQFCRLGRGCFTAIASVVVKDVPPFVMVEGNSARPRGLNRVGLKRREFSSEDIEALRQAYKILYRGGLLLKDALEALEPLAAGNKHVRLFRDFVAASERGVSR